MTNNTGNIDQNQNNKEEIKTPGQEKSPEQLRLEKDKADHASKPTSQSEHVGSDKSEKKE